MGKNIKKIGIGLLASVMLLGFNTNAQENNTPLALKRLLMITGVELLQRNTPKETTKAEFNKQLAENKVSEEGIVFLNKAFEFYKKETSTDKILTSYDGTESYELIQYIVNGGKNAFGNLNDTQELENKNLWKWLRSVLIAINNVAQIAITICDLLPWPC